MNKEKLMIVGVIASLALGATGTCLGIVDLATRNAEPNNLLYTAVKQEVSREVGATYYVEFARQLETSEVIVPKNSNYCVAGEHTFQVAPDVYTINVYTYEFKATNRIDDVKIAYGFAYQCQEHTNNYKFKVCIK